jgi:hypothetical protein
MYSQKMLFDPKRDFKELKYADVFSVEKNLLENIKELRPYAVMLSHEGDNKRPDLDKLVRFIMALYDKKSPIIKQLTNLDQRKKEAALVAGYDLKFDADTLDALFAFTDHEMQILALQFLKDQNDMYWTMIVSNEQTFWEFQRALNQRIKDTKDDKQWMDALNVKSKLMEECDRITERVETYYVKVFGDGDALAKAKQTRGFSPEAIAHRKKNV